MAWLPVSGLPTQYAIDSSSLASGYYLKFYEMGTTTPVSMSSNSTGTPLFTQVKLNNIGIPITNPAENESTFVPYMEVNYKAVIFKSETAATTNDTNEALFVADNIEVGQIITGNAADLTIRDTTILAQDDFDRSILFTDGDGFTAGAGPHVFTVTSDYTPTNSDFRAYKRDNSGIMAAIVTQSETATQFTYTGTLASTDIIFVGDDTNRSLGVFASSDSTNNAAIYSETASTSLGGDFTAGTFKAAKIGSMVTITLKDMTFSVTTIAQSAGGQIASSYRPTGSSVTTATESTTAGLTAQITIDNGGSITVTFNGARTFLTSASISYII